MKILQTILLACSRDHLYSNYLRGKQNSVEPTVRAYWSAQQAKERSKKKLQSIQDHQPEKSNLQLTDRIAIMKQGTGMKQ